MPERAGHVHIARRSEAGWPADLSENEILSRLLALNVERAEEEKAVKPSKAKTSREKTEAELN